MPAPRLPLVPPLGPLLALREAAGRAIADLGGPVAVANTLHTSPELVDRLWRSRRRQDLRDLMELVGRCKAVRNRGAAVGKPVVRPVSGGQPPDLFTAASAPRDPLATAMIQENRRAAIIIGVGALAKAIGISRAALCDRLAAPDMELTLLIEAVVGRDIPTFHRTTTTTTDDF